MIFPSAENGIDEQITTQKSVCRKWLKRMVLRARWLEAKKKKKKEEKKNQQPRESVWRENILFFIFFAILDFIFSNLCKPITV